MSEVKQPQVPDVKDTKSESGDEYEGNSVARVERDELLEQRAMRKFDYIVMPLITMFCEYSVRFPVSPTINAYIDFLSFLDRSNIGNARTGGLLTDLGITATQFSIALTVTYIPYSLIELPSNVRASESQLYPC